MSTTQSGIASLPKFLEVTHSRKPAMEDGGTIEFDNSKSCFIRVNVQNTCSGEEWNRLAKRVLTHMTVAWELKHPDLLISVTGGAKLFNRQPRLERIVKESLVNAAYNTGAWIITGGTATGVMKMVGEAVEDHNLLTSNSTRENTIVALGIASWGFVEKNLSQKLKDNSGNPIDIRTSSQIETLNSGDQSETAHLDQNHTHFILVDDGSSGKPGGEIEFRSRLEDYIFKRSDAQTVKQADEEKREEGVQPLIPTVGQEFPMMSSLLKCCADSTLREGSSEQQPAEVGPEQQRNEDKHVTPTVLIVVNGGVNTVKTVGKSLKQGCPVVVIAGSGRAADYIARECERKGEISDEDLVNETKRVLQLEGSEREKEAKKAKKCLQNKILPRKDLLTIFHRDKDDLVQDIESAVLSAILKAKDKKPEPELRQEVLQHALSLAIKWHRGDFAEQKILSTREAVINKILFRDALLEDLHMFVENVLDVELVTLRNMVDDDIFEGLLCHSAKRSKEMSKLLGHAASSLKESDDFTLANLNRVIAVLMRDDRFSLYTGKDGTPNSNTSSTGGGTSDDKAKPEECRHLERNLFLWAVLFNRRDMATLFWKLGIDHLGTALCASNLLKRLSDMAAKKELGELSSDLQKHSQEWEQRAYDVLTKCYSRDATLTYRLLVRQLPSSRNRTASPTLLNMAESYEMMHFVGHSACQTKLTVIWKGRMAVDTHVLLILLCIILPFFIPLIYFYGENGDNKTRDSTDQTQTQNSTKRCWHIGCWSSLHFFYTAPITKFFLNILAKLVFLCLFSYVLLITLDEGSPSIPEYITWAWLFTLMVEELRQVLFQDLLFINWVSKIWNQLDMAVFLFSIISVILRYLLPMYDGDFKWARAFYSITLVLCYLRLMQYFYAVKSMGPKVIMIQKMMKDMFQFLAVLAVFVIAFGVGYHTNMFPNSPADWNIIVNVVYYPYFQIYGELFLENMRGESIEECTRNESVWRLDPKRRCPEDSRYILHLMLAAYLIVTNILLVNLLIAMFSYTFQRVQQNSVNVWRFNRLSLVHEYFDRPALVPPFIVLNHLFRAFRRWCCDTKYNAFSRKYPKEMSRRLALFERSAAKTCILKKTDSMAHTT